MIWSYPATNCSSVSEDCSLKWELGHKKKKKKANKRENATYSWAECIKWTSKPPKQTCDTVTCKCRLITPFKQVNPVYVNMSSMLANFCLTQKCELECSVKLESWQIKSMTKNKRCVETRQVLCFEVPPLQSFVLVSYYSFSRV